MFGAGGGLKLLQDGMWEAKVRGRCPHCPSERRSSVTWAMLEAQTQDRPPGSKSQRRGSGAPLHKAPKETLGKASRLAVTDP